MEAVTVDTNIFPIADIENLALKAGYMLEVISVTNRELEATDLSETAGKLTETLETLHFGEGAWGRAVWGSITDAEHFEAILHIISSGGYPKDRENVTPKQKNQRRDALILQAHIRSGKTIFISNDERGFVKHGKREKLETMFDVTIFTRLEFIAHCKAIYAKQ